MDGLTAQPASTEPSGEPGWVLWKWGHLECRRPGWVDVHIPRSSAASQQRRRGLRQPNSDSNSHGDGNSNRHSHSNGDSVTYANAYAPAEADADAKAASNAVTACGLLLLRQF